MRMMMMMMMMICDSDGSADDDNEHGDNEVRALGDDSPTLICSPDQWGLDPWGFHSYM